MGLHYQNTSVWTRAVELATEIYLLVPRLPKEEVYGMRSQLTRAAVSVAANIAEGWSRETDRDRGHFLAVAQGSLAETETLVTICEKLHWMSTAHTSVARSLIVEVSKMLTALRGKLREKSSASVS